MGNEYIMIKIKDNNNYLDNNEETILYQFLVEKDKDFDEKYEKLLKICKDYLDFQEIIDFICDNFKEIKVDEREIWV